MNPCLLNGMPYGQGGGVGADMDIANIHIIPYFAKFFLGEGQ